jgi:hypothetical protein
MIEPTEYTVSKELLTSARESLPEVEFKFALNTPTGDFFYDKWVIKNEFKNTVWEEILNSLPVDNKGEARLIKLDIERCYTMHADIDDRWHLSFDNNNSCLIDLENNKMYQPELGVWHSMNAGILHSAVNFGDSARYQLVVRQLLPKCKLLDPVNVELQLRKPPANYRYVLDNYISPKLNTMCKDKKISKFKPFSDKHISLTIEKSSLLDLDNAIKATNIDIEVNYYDSVL